MSNQSGARMHSSRQRPELNDQCLVFMHIPKTAGTTLYPSLQWNYPPHQTYPPDVGSGPEARSDGLRGDVEQPYLDAPDLGLALQVEPQHALAFMGTAPRGPRVPAGPRTAEPTGCPTANGTVDLRGSARGTSLASTDRRTLFP